MRRSESGVTLMELIVAVSLVGLLSLGILYSIRIGLAAMEKSGQRMLADRRVMGTQRILEQQIAGFMAAAMECRAQDGPPRKTTFFQGGADTLRFVSSYSLQEGARGYPRVLEYAVIPGDKGAGVRLVVNEFLYTGPASLGPVCQGIAPDPSTGAPIPILQPVQIGPASFVLADKLAYCRFVYKRGMPPPVLEEWMPAWIHPYYPQAIRIELAPLQPDKAVLPLLSLTLPVHVSRDPLVQYVD